MGKLEDLYFIKEPLGAGSYAEVYRCTHKVENTDYALKMVSRQKAGKSGTDSVKNEVGILQSLQHTNIIRVNDYFESSATLYIVLELVLGGELFEKIVELKYYSEALAARLVHNICLTLKYLHDQGICHRDLKPENLLLKERDAKKPLSSQIPTDHDLTDAEIAKFEEMLTNIKLVDFGFATRFEPGTSKLVECCGTPNFIAPEILEYGYFKSRKEGYNEKCDIWSTGALAFVLLCGYPPFHGSSRSSMFRHICKDPIQFDKDTPWDSISANAKDFVTKLMDKNPDTRYSATQALQHPWIVSFTEVPLTQQLTSRGGSVEVAHLAQTVQNIKTFNARAKFRAAIFSMEAMHRLVYITKCKELKIKPNTALTQQLGKEEQQDEDLTTLDLRSNYLGSKGLRAALEAIADTGSTVHTVLLSGNQVDTDAVTVICDVLKTKFSVTSLDLSDNPITQLAGRQLLNFVQVNRNILHLNLQRTQVKDTMLARIEAQCERNQANAKSKNCSFM